MALVIMISTQYGEKYSERTKMLLCPNCTTELKKDNRQGEGVWYCPQEECKNTWFILNIPGADYYLKKGKRKQNE